MKKKRSAQTASELDSILEKARPFQEIELAVNNSEEDRQAFQAAVTDAQLHAYFEDDLSLFSAEEIMKAKQKEGESLERHI